MKIIECTSEDIFKDNVTSYSQNDPVDFLKSKAYNEFKKSAGVNKDMSFVGIFKCVDGVLAVGDSKGTRNGDHDIFRGKIKKVFKNEHLLLVTHGNNEIGNTNIENILEEIIEKRNANFDDFIDIFEKELMKAKDFRMFEFILYTKENDMNYFIEFEFSRLKSVRQTETSAYAGVNYYINGFSELFKKGTLATDTTGILLYNVDDFKEKIIDILNKTITTLDTLPFYNAVGLPINYEIIKYNDK